MQKLKLFLIVFLAFSVPSIGYAQATVAEQPFVEVSIGDSFHSSLLKAARARIETSSDKIQARKDYWRIRRAMLLPRMREDIRQLVVMQIKLEVENGQSSAAVPMVDGEVNEAAIDWDALLKFLEKLIPIILQLIDIFS